MTSGGKLGGKDNSGLLFVAPFFVLFMVFGVFGLAFNFFVSFHRWQPISEDPSFQFRGLQGYARVLARDDFWVAVAQSVLTAIPTILVLHFVAFTLAYAMFLLFRRQLSALGLLMFVPYMAVPVGLGSSIGFILNIFFLPLTELLAFLHGIWPAIPKENNLLFGAIYESSYVIWKTLGWNMLLYMMAFAAIPRSTLEAAALDGASFWAQLRRIALPLARPMVFVAVSMSLGSILQTSNWRPGADFGQPPFGVPALTYLEAFGYQNFDAASVMTCLFFAIMLLLVLALYGFFGRNFTQIEQPAALEVNTMPVRLPPVTRLLIQLLVIFTAIMCLLPFLGSLSQATQHRQFGDDTWWQTRLSIQGHSVTNYSGLMTALPTFWRSFWNSLYVSGLAALGATLVCAFAGFAFATLEFRGKQFLFGVVMCAMVFPAMSNAIPYVIQMRVFDWLNTPRALWLPSCVFALGVFLVRQFALNALPKLMLEAARVDGASTWRIFWRIAMPNLIPVLVAVALLVFVTTWNGLDAAYFVMRDLETRMIKDTIGLLTSPQARTAFNAGGQDFSFLDAAAMASALSTIPALLAFLLASRHLGRGLGLGEWSFSWRGIWAGLRGLSGSASTTGAAASSSPNLATPTLAGVTGFRGIVVIFLVMGHVWQRFTVEGTTPEILGSIQGFFASGGFRVSSFFVLSAMLLSQPFWRRFLDGGRPDLRQFARRRFWRIAPAFWTCLLVSFVFSGMQAFLPLEDQPWRWLRLLAGLSFTSGLHYLTYFQVELNGPLWSIGFEAIFYVVMPLCMLGLFALRRNRPASMPLAVAYWLGILAAVMLAQEWLIRNAIPDSAGRGWDHGLVGGAKQWFPNYNPIGFFGHYAIGVLSGAFVAWWSWRAKRLERRPQHLVFDALAIISSIAALTVMWTHTTTSEYAWSIGDQPAAFPFFTTIIGVLLASLPFSLTVWRLFDTRFLRYTGRISFSLFLWHHLILEMIWLFHDFRYNRAGTLTDVGTWAWISVGAVLLIYFVSHLSYEHIERPFLERSNQSPAPRSPVSQTSRASAVEVV
jgi:ABC-type glycerol-3-phosphate transport system permease component/peptidoglycan/LPS O-acetylase OafA/YrhL